MWVYGRGNPLRVSEGLSYIDGAFVGATVGLAPTRVERRGVSMVDPTARTSFMTVEWSRASHLSGMILASTLQALLLASNVVAEMEIT